MVLFQLFLQEDSVRLKDSIDMTQEDKCEKRRAGYKPKYRVLARMSVEPVVLGAVRDLDDEYRVKLEIGRRIAAIIELHQHSGAYLSRKLGYSDNYIGRVISTHYQFKFEHLLKIAQVYNISLDYFNLNKRVVFDKGKIKIVTVKLK